MGTPVSLYQSTPPVLGPERKSPESGVPTVVLKRGIEPGSEGTLR